MHCPVWICGLENMGIVLGTVRKTSPTEVRLTTDRLAKHKKSLTLKIGKALVMDRPQSYGLAVVSCLNTVPRPYLMATDRRARLTEEDIDLSKLELVDFFPFTDHKKPSVRLSPAKGLREYASQFELFVNATENERKQLLLGTYPNDHIERSSKLGKKRGAYVTTQISAAQAE
jgi:hypothetical protein